MSRAERIEEAARALRDRNPYGREVNRGYGPKVIAEVEMPLLAALFAALDMPREPTPSPAGAPACKYSHEGVEVCMKCGWVNPDLARCPPHAFEDGSWCLKCGDEAPPAAPKAPEREPPATGDKEGGK